MRHLLGGCLLLMYVLICFANKNNCSSEIEGYKVVKNSIYSFIVDNEKSCFFAFYTTNPEPMTDIKGNGNLGDAIWYGYYKMREPIIVHEFPKPLGTDWSGVCTVDAISFYSMYGDKKPSVTVIGSCDKNSINYTVAFVFIRQGKKYVLDEKLYITLYGYIGMTVADVREYIRSPASYFKVLEARNKSYGPCK